MSDILGRGERALAAIATRARSFSRRAEGSIAIIFAFSSLIIIMVIGAAIDYTRVSNADTEYQVACDRGVLSAMREVQVIQLDGETPDLGALPSIATKAFEANVGSNNKSHGVVFSSTYTLNDEKTKITGHGTYSGLVPLGIGAIVGGTNVTVSGECEIVVANAVGIDFHFLLDTSMSMGLAATPLDRFKMQRGTAADPRISDQDKDEDWYNKLPPKGCSFACHTPRRNNDPKKPVFPVGRMSTMQWARANGIKLRIDVERDGVDRIAAVALADSARDYRVSLSTFNEVYKSVLAATSDLASVQGKLGELTLGYPNKTDPREDSVPTWPDSNDGFALFASNLTSEMQSADASGRRHVIILVTDGVRSQPGFNSDSGLLHEFKPEYCKKLRDTGAIVAVIYTKYLKDPENLEFKLKVADYYDKIRPALAACPSDPSFFVEGDTPEEIMAGFDRIFALTTTALALSK